MTPFDEPCQSLQKNLSASSSPPSLQRSWLPLLVAVMILEVVTFKVLWARDPLVANRAYHRAEAQRLAGQRAVIERHDLALGQPVPRLMVTPVAGTTVPQPGEGRAMALLFVRSCAG